MKKVLLVDDEPNIIMSLEFLMKKNGYAVFIARDGREAIGLLDRHQPDVIILDIMMPEVDGYEVCSYIQNNSELNTKIILLTAKGTEKDIKKGYEAGADHYITKPFSTKHVVKTVQNLTA